MEQQMEQSVQNIRTANLSTNETLETYRLQSIDRQRRNRSGFSGSTVVVVFR